MAISQIAISVCNDGNVSQLDCTDTVAGGIYYRIEVYRSSQPAGGFGVTLSGTRAEHVCGLDHLGQDSNQIFRYIFSVTDRKDLSGGGTAPAVIEGYDQFNPEGTPDGSWEVRLRDLDASSAAYGSIFRINAQPGAKDGCYAIGYEMRMPEDLEPKEIHSPLEGRITDLNPGLCDLGTSLENLPPVVHVHGENLVAIDGENPPIDFSDAMSRIDVDQALSSMIDLISHQRMRVFRENLDRYEAFGDFGPKAIHPGTNLIGPNKELASESIFARQYRAALVFVGRVSSPDMARGAADPVSLAQAPTNTRPGVYEKFVTATINNVAIYKLGLDKVHSDYGGVPMALAPGSRMETGVEPAADAWRCNQTLGEVANLFYLTN